MAKKLASRSAQWPLYQEFVFNFNDWALDSATSVKQTFGAAVTNTGAANAVDPATGLVEAGLTGGVSGSLVFDALPMPVGAVVVGGQVITETAFATSTAVTLSVGVSGAATAFLSATDIKAVVNTPFVTTAALPLTCNGGANIRLTFAYTVAAATTGKCRVRVFYTLDGKSNENTIS